MIVAQQDLFLVRCLGCKEYILGGTGKKDDPVMDITYFEHNPESSDWTGPVWVCPECFITQEKREAN